jgi:hypothetical protein
LPRCAGNQNQLSSRQKTSSWYLDFRSRGALRVPFGPKGFGQALRNKAFGARL